MGAQQTARRGAMARCIAAVVAAVAVVGGVVPAAWAGTESCSLRVAYVVYPPYQDTRDGRAVGMDPEMVRAIAREADCAVTFRQVPWERGLKAIERGTIDAGVNVTHSEERAEYGYFTEPYRKERVRLLVREGDTAILEHDTIEAVVKADNRIGVTRGFYYGPEVAELREQPETADAFDESSTTRNDVRKLAHGRLDGVLMDPLGGRKIVERLGVGDAVTWHPMHVFDTPTHLMLSRESTTPAVVKRLDAAIKTLKADGTLAGIRKTYR